MITTLMSSDIILGNTVRIPSPCAKPAPLKQRNIRTYVIGFFFCFADLARCCQKTKRGYFRRFECTQIWGHCIASQKVPFMYYVSTCRGTVCWNGVLCGHFLGIKIQHWNKCLSSTLYHFLSFRSVFSTLSQRDAWKKLKPPKVGKRCIKLSFFLWFTHWWNHLWETDWLGVGKEILKFYEN